MGGWLGYYAIPANGMATFGTKSPYLWAGNFSLIRANDAAWCPLLELC